LTFQIHFFFIPDAATGIYEMASGQKQWSCEMQWQASPPAGEPGILTGGE
jgi:hypothetical protein